MTEDDTSSKRGEGREKNTQVKEHQENNKILDRHKGKHCFNRIKHQNRINKYPD